MGSRRDVLSCIKRRFPAEQAFSLAPPGGGLGGSKTTTKSLTIKIAIFSKFHCHGDSQEKRRLWTSFPQVPPSPAPSKTQILLILSFGVSEGLCKRFFCRHDFMKVCVEQVQVTQAQGQGVSLGDAPRQILESSGPRAPVKNQGFLCQAWMGQNVNRQNRLCSVSGGQLSQTIPQFHVEHMLHE